jgi:hypothetical protein
VQPRGFRSRTALTGVQAAGIIYGTDVFCALVQRPALAQLDDATIDADPDHYNAVNLEGRRLRLLGWRCNCRRVPADDYPPWEKRSTLARPQAQLWVLALAVQAGLWAAVAPFLWRTCREFSPATRWGWVGWLLLSAVVVVLFLRLEQARL